MDVLVVDDAGQVRTRLAALFRDVEGIQCVLEADSEKQAEDVLMRHTPGVVVLDLHLGRTSGLALIERIKREWNTTVVVVLTNDASEHHRRRCSDLGADHFFDKSTEFEAVLPVLAEVAAR